MEFKMSVGIGLLKSVWGYLMAWFFLPVNVKKMEAKLEDRKLSPYVRNCPNCEAKGTTQWMEIVFSDGPTWDYKCVPCKRIFSIKVQ